MNTVKKLFSGLCAAVMIFSFAACGDDGKTEETTTAGQTEAAAETTSAAVTDVTVDSLIEDETTEQSEKEIVLKDGLNSTEVEEVLEFYKLAAAVNKDKEYCKTIHLISMYGGERFDKLVSVFEPIAQKALAKNSIDNDPLPGKYESIKVSDWKSAKAVTDGRYTTITVQVVPQTDDANGTLFGGPVGRSISVLDGMNTAVNEMPGVSADFDGGNVYMEYLNPSITVKIDNSTGEFVKGSCKWYYQVHPVLDYLKAKVLAFNVELEGAYGYLDYTVTY